MVNHVQKPKKKPPRPPLEDRIPKIRLRKVFASRNLGILLLFLLCLYSISPGLRLRWDKYQEGKPAEDSVYAETDFQVEDREETRLVRERAASLTPPVYELESDLVRSSVEAARQHLDKIQMDVLNPVFTREERISLLSKYMLSSTSQSTLELIADMDEEGFQSMRGACLAMVEEVSRQGVLSDVPGSAKDITIYTRDDRTQRTVKVDEVLTLKKVADALVPLTQQRFKSKPQQRALAEISLPFIKNTLTFSEKLTQIAQEEQKRLTPPVLRTFSKGQKIVEKGEPVTKQDLLELEAHETAVSKATGFQVYLGNALLLVILFGCFLYYLYRYRPEIYGNNTALFLIGIMVFLTLGFGRILIILLPEVWLYLVPVAAGGILLSTLVDDKLAFTYAFFISILYAAQGGNRFDLLVVGVVGSLAGIYYLRTIRKRSDIFWPGIVVAGANMATIATLRLVGIVGDQLAILVGAASGLITAIAAVPGILIPLETFFGIATNIRLLELSDLNHPLLKKLAMQAPGTYHHCLMVGNMADAAAEQIGANSLLARVGSYYHDVGKMNKPLYFSENQRDGRNKHDELTPSMSALILISHVKEGVELAREYRLNPPIVEFIQQHHGTSLMPYFYQKALEQDANAKEDNFRYPGPNPQSREAAICMLADSVEAASRTLANPTHGRIKSLVEKIINNKFVDSQLDECDLTLKDLHKIADSFVRVLAGFLHSRVEYPEEQTIPEIKGKFESVDTKIGAKTGNKVRSDSKGG